MTAQQRDAAIARCDAEILEMKAQANVHSMPAWIVTLGIEDWEMEKRLIHIQFDQRARAAARLVRPLQDTRDQGHAYEMYRARTTPGRWQGRKLSRGTAEHRLRGAAGSAKAS